MKKKNIYIDLYAPCQIYYDLVNAPCQIYYDLVKCLIQLSKFDANTELRY